MTGIIETSQANTLPNGATIRRVRRLLGEPARIRRAESVTTPTQVFAELGLTFRFDDSGLQEIWEYRHKVRKRLRFLFGFRRGRLVQAWRETLTPERAEELERLSGESD